MGAPGRYHGSKADFLRQILGGSEPHSHRGRVNRTALPSLRLSGRSRVGSIP
jgi:hypothetical protein